MELKLFVVNKKVMEEMIQMKDEVQNGVCYKGWWTTGR